MFLTLSGRHAPVQQGSCEPHISNLFPTIGEWDLSIPTTCFHQDRFVMVEIGGLFLSFEFFWARNGASEKCPSTTKEWGQIKGFKLKAEGLVFRTCGFKLKCQVSSLTCEIW